MQSKLESSSYYQKDNNFTTTKGIINFVQWKARRSLHEVLHTDFFKPTSVFVVNKINDEYEKGSRNEFRWTSGCI